MQNREKRDEENSFFRNVLRKGEIKVEKENGRGESAARRTKVLEASLSRRV